MSYSISDLLIRNLRDVFGETDPARRRAAIDELWAEDGVFYDPSKGAIRGRDAIDRIAGAVDACRPTPGGTSSLRGTAGSRRFICFSTSGPEFESTKRGASCGTASATGPEKEDSR